MMFCPKCGSLLKTKQDNGKPVKFCACGYSSKLKKDEATIKENVKREKDDIEVVDKDSTAEVHPVADAECPKCGHSASATG